MKHKKIALISSFCDNQDKIDVLKRNINTIKSLGIDVFVVSPFILDKDIVDCCDYFFVTKDNPVFDWPERAMYAWRILSHREKNYRITTTYADYGFAGLFQVKQLSQIALNLEYDQFFHLIYDLKIDENVLDGFNSNKTNIVYPSKRGDTIWAVGLHFMIFDKENLQNFVSKITKQSYLDLKGADAFVWLYNHQEILNYEIAEKPVEDEIYYYTDHDFFNFSPIPNLNFFIEKNDQTLGPIKLVFYNNTDNLKISIRIDDVEAHHEINNMDILNLDFNKTNPKKVIINFKDTEYDISSIINKIKHNTFEIL